MSVMDLSIELFKKLPSGYQISNCQFAPQSDPFHAWWGCNLYIPADTQKEALKEKRKAFAGLIPIDQNGNLGEMRLLNSSVGHKYFWTKMLSIGTNNMILAVDNDHLDTLISALCVPSAASDKLINPSLQWQYNVPMRTPESFNTTIKQATATEDGGYVVLIQDQTSEVRVENLDWFAVARFTQERQGVWRHIYENNFCAATQAQWSSEDRNFILLDRGKTVVYGRSCEGFNDYGNDICGTYVSCLDSNGQEISKNFFENYSWSNPVRWFDGGFVFLNYRYDMARYSLDFFSHLSVFNKDCQHMGDRQIIFPPHAIKGKTCNHIQATAPAVNGNLIVVYTQIEILPNVNQNYQPMPSLYLAELNPQLNIVSDIALITGDDKNRAYLQFFGYSPMADEFGAEGDNILKINLLFLKKTNEILVSVYNKRVQPEKNLKQLPDHWSPKMYKVKLPC